YSPGRAREPGGRASLRARGARGAAIRALERQQPRLGRVGGERRGDEAVQLGGAVRPLAARVGHRGQDADLLHLAAEVAAVQRPAQDRLKQRLQLAQRELVRQQLEAQGRLADPAAQVVQGGLQQRGVVEGQPRQRGRPRYVEPAAGRRVAGGRQLVAVAL